MASIDIPNACQDSASEPVGTTSLEALSCNLRFIDEVANSTAETATNRVGQQVITASAAINKFGFGIAEFTFATGGTLDSLNLLISNEPTDSYLYKYVGAGSAPVVVTAGTNPAGNPDWQAFTATRLQELSGLTEPSALDQRYTVNTTVAEVESGVFSVIGTELHLSDRDGGVFVITAGGTPDGHGVLNAGNGNTAVYQPAINPVVKVTHFGANGLSDDAAAFQSAGSFSNSVFCPKLTTPYKVSTVETSQSVTYYGAMDGTTEIETVGGINNPMFFNRVTGRKLALVDLTLTGSGLNGVGTGSPHFRGAGIWCSAGELTVSGCTIANFSAQAIWTGNISDNWDINVYVDRCLIEHCVISQGEQAAGLGDCMRLERTNNLQVLHNECSGGLSGIRSQLYCKDVDISHNHVYGSYGDVGITVAHSSDITISNNDCHNHHAHGFEIDSSYRVKVDNNKAHSNGERGILVSEYATPNNPWYAGYLDDVLIAPAQVVWPDINDINNNMCFNNGESGLHFISPSRCTGSGNKFWNNCTANPLFTSHILVGTTAESGFSQDVTISDNEYNNSALCGAGLRIDSYQTESISPVKAFNNKLVSGGILSRQPTYGSSNRLKFSEPIERFTSGYLIANQDQSIDSEHGFSWQLVDDATPAQKNITWNIPSGSYSRRLLARVRFKGVSSLCKLIVQEYQVDSNGLETFRRTLSNQTFTSSNVISSRVAYVDSTTNNDYNVIKLQFVTDDDAGATVDVLDAHLSWVE